jgi:6-pyruvoyltetrahydropterin/6-carboxytetrahydropterin synthase
MKTTVTRLIEFDAGHRLVGHESKCAHMHGHRYRAEIRCTAEALDKVGRVIDFGVIKQLVGGWVDDHWDHAFIVNRQDTKVLALLVEMNQRHYVLPWEPTAENLARVLLEQARWLLGPHGVQVEAVKLWETPNCYAEVTEGEPPIG